MSESRKRKAKKRKEIQDELKYWKESYYKLNRKYRKLKSGNTSMAEEMEPPAKKARIEDNEKSMDPLKLPEPCTQAIMKYLTVKELMKATEVSKYWKEFIESRSFLMNQILDNIVVKPTINDYPLPLINDLFDEDNAKRAYKHMRGPLQMVQKFDTTISPIVYYASTLETLTVPVQFKSEKDGEIISVHDSDSDMDSDSEDDTETEFEKCDFPKLQKAIIGKSWKEFENFSFPVLTHLRVEVFFSQSLKTFERFEKFLSKCPKLKVLDIDNSFIQLSSLNEPALMNPKQPKIDFIRIRVYHSNFLRSQQFSLVKLEVKNITFEGVSLILRDLKLLKSLTFGAVIINGDYNLTRHENIEQLRIDYFEEDLFEQLPFLFLAVPSLSEFVFTLGLDLSAETLKFIASNMRYLKRLMCKEFNPELLSAYKEIKRNRRQYVNSSFELITDPDLEFYEMQNEFKELPH